MFNITVKVTDKKALSIFVKVMICSCPKTSEMNISSNIISIKDPVDANWINTNRVKKLLACGEIKSIEIDTAQVNEDNISEDVKVEKSNKDETGSFSIIDDILCESENFHDVSVMLYKAFDIKSRKNVGVNRLESLFKQYEGSTISPTQVRKVISNRLFKAAKEHGFDLVAVINYILCKASESDDSPSEDKESD